MSFTWIRFFTRPTYQLFANHTFNFFLVYKSMNSRYTLICSDSCEVLQGSEEFFRHNNRRFVFFYGNSLLSDRFNSINDAIRNDCVKHIDHVLFVWKFISFLIGKVLLNLLPLLPILTTFPYSFCCELFPVGQMLNPPYTCLFQQLFLTTQDVSTKYCRHIPCWWSVSLTMIVKEIKHSTPVWTFLGEF